MGPALRRDGFGGVGGSPAKVVFAVGADAEVSRIAIDAGLEAGVEGMAAGRERHVLPSLKKIAVSLHYRAGGRVECLEESIVELDRRVGVIAGGKAGCGACDADGGLEHQTRRDGARVSSDDIALAIDVLNAEGWIDGGLVGICCGTG